VARDSSLAVRNAMLALAKADAALVALVPKASIYTQWTAAVPPYPFIRSGPPSGVPIRGSCLDGLDITLAWHAFSNGVRNTAGTITLPAEDHAGQIGAALAKALDGKVAVIPGGKVKIRWTGSQLLQDPEESQVFHSIQSFRARAITA